MGDEHTAGYGERRLEPLRAGARGALLAWSSLLGGCAEIQVKVKAKFLCR